LFPIGRAKGSSGLYSFCGVGWQRRSTGQRYLSGYWLHETKQNRKQLLDARAREASNTDNGTRAYFKLIYGESTWRFQSDNTKRT
jgi:hypothetical protein